MAGVHLQQLPAEVLREMWCREWLGSVQQFAECHNMRNSPRRLQAWLDGEIEDRSCEGEVVFFLFGMCQSMQWPVRPAGGCRGNVRQHVARCKLKWCAARQPEGEVVSVRFCMA